MHLGEADYALPNAQGYDEMKYRGLYHLNATLTPIRRGFQTWSRFVRACSRGVTKGAMSGNAGQQRAREEFKINGQYVDTPVINGKEGVVGNSSSTATSKKRRSNTWIVTPSSPEPIFRSINLHEGASTEYAAPGLHP